MSLQTSVDQYKEIFNLLPIGLYRTSIKDGKFLNANPYCAEMLGYDSVDELLEKEASCNLYYDPSERERFIKEIEDKKGIVENYELKLKLHDGSTKWVAITARKTKNYLEGSLMDITDRKNMEAELESYKTNEIKSLAIISEAAKQRCDMHDGRAVYEKSHDGY